MTPRPTTKNGKPCWTLDARAEGKGRLYAETRDGVLKKYRSLVLGLDDIEFTDQDRLAKQELGDRGTLLECVRYWLARKPASQQLDLETAADRWTNELKVAGVTPGYIASASTTLKHFRAHAGATTPLDAITPDHIRAFLASGAWSAAYRNTLRSRLASFFHWAVTAGACTEHPIANRQVRAIKEPKRTPRIFTVEECTVLLKTAREQIPHMIPFLVLGIFCGIRPDRAGEMGKLTAADIHLADRTIEVPASKGDCRRTIELSENAITWLRLVPTLTITTDRYWRRKLCEAAGVDWSADVMRHTFASYHIKHHQNPGATALMMGHERSLKMLYKHYVAPVTKQAAAQFWSLTPDPVVTIATGTHD